MRISKFIWAILTIFLFSFSMQSFAFCGFFAGKADASLFNEASQVVLVRDGKRSVISMLNDYRGQLNDFALVVPVPQVLEKGQVRIGDKHLFDRLDAYSSPRVAEYFDPDPCPVGRQYLEELKKMRADNAVYPSAAPAQKKESDKALGVTVEDSYTVGEYDIVMLSAKQSDGLETWLVTNGYKMPKGASAALKPYIAQNMKFFVAKVNLKEQAATGVQYLRPLQFAFDSEKFMLPIRLGMINADPHKPQDLIAYVLTKNGRVESANYRTVKLPANENLPPAIKRDFNAFYIAMFDHQAKKENHRVVFTEYFWDMGWCDPCADQPLSRDELRQAGVFWLNNGFDDNSGAQNALLTRLHVRYTPKTFPEDLMFTQTSDRENWQTRYVVQNPFEGSVQSCREKAANYSCESMCRNEDDTWSPRERRGYARSCMQSCKASNSSAVEQARRYYETDLPQRQQTEMQTLMRYTGWSKRDAARFLGADLRFYDSPEDFKPSSNEKQPDKKDRWWEQLFGKGRSS